jgi:cytoskeletal protein RodZ
MDLREAAQQTRIAFNYLKAMEEEDFTKLPGEVFVKGFLKNYARFLRLSEEDVMRRYAEIASPKVVAPQGGGAGAAKTDVQKPAAAASAAPVPASPPRPSLPVAGINLEPYLWSGILLIALIAFIVVALPRRQPPKEHAGPTLSTTTTTTEVVTATTATSVPEKLYLDILALEDVWVLIRTDASPQKKAVLKQGEAVTWSADKRFIVSYGSVGAAKLVLNGKELTVPGAKSAVVRDLMITATGVVTQKTEPDQPKPKKLKPVTSPAVQQQPTITQPHQEKPQQEPMQQNPARVPDEPSVPTPPPPATSAPERTTSPFEM